MVKRKTAKKVAGKKRRAAARGPEHTIMDRINDLIAAVGKAFGPAKTKKLKAKAGKKKVVKKAAPSARKAAKRVTAKARKPAIKVKSAKAKTAKQSKPSAGIPA